MNIASALKEPKTITRLGPVLVDESYAPKTSKTTGRTTRFLLVSDSSGSVFIEVAGGEIRDSLVEKGKWISLAPGDGRLKVGEKKGKTIIEFSPGSLLGAEAPDVADDYTGEDLAENHARLADESLASTHPYVEAWSKSLPAEQVNDLRVQLASEFANSILK